MIRVKLYKISLKTDEYKVFLDIFGLVNCINLK